MYVQITERCNMHCPHCCNSCTDVGRDMPMQLFDRCLELADNFGDGIFIGGGEPTLHPKFPEILGKVILQGGEGSGVITNGSDEKITMGLLRAFCKEDSGFYVGVSVDELHDLSLVSKAVKDFVKKNPHANHGVTWQNVVPVGRAADKQSYTGRPETSCVCSDINILVDGTVRICGCPTAPCIGRIFDDDIEERLATVMQHECYRETDMTDYEELVGSLQGAVAG